MRTLTTAVVLSLAATSVGAAQDDFVISGPPRCADCTIELTHLVSLGALDGPGALPGGITSVAQDSEGRYYVASSPGTELYVFSSTGEFLRTIGREGEGPGEFRRLEDVLVGPGDTLYLFDRDLGRIVVMTEDGEAVRHASSLRTGRAQVRLADGRFVVNADYRDRRRIGYPLHLHAPDGAYLRAFGAVRPAYGPTVVTSRGLAVGPNGTFWSVHPWRYEIEAWSLETGTRTRVGVRRMHGFPVPTERMTLGTTPERPPHPRVSAFHIDAAGRMWTLVPVSDPNWAEGLGPERQMGEARWYPKEDFDAIYDTIIEVIDPRTGRLIASQRFPQYLRYFLNDTTIGGPRISEYGDSRVEIWRLQLLDP